jgi:hypothetical protein
MITFVNAAHALHRGKLELYRGELGTFERTGSFGDAALTTVLCPRY